MKFFISNSIDDTFQLGRRLGSRLAAGDCVALDGELGAGKTAFVRGLAAGMGCDERLVSSPTYVLMQEYPGPIPLYHLDLYRMGDAAAEFTDMFPEELLENGVMVIEWAGMAENVLPLPRTHITIKILSETSRKFTINEIA
ncbi:MAG TPA: tRNA (adenosine(37)-N6)-threonylcarbamoyltransferase complex ATPase subunit type 1 TsaE [Phycisphaerae bacterium]|nr:tRNA (adenosine(37)-N6)-threonylcarbamoyltransferase complex ATPase subunit type 1 TsaE [Phycisphaerae bacterium]HPS53686.1 tRNA (adenosine(37)-N6)-threonylcarbamoyltransferase complex ATPase subunit type 1 TsaE [Phycisphaerae bacterium]